GTLDGREDRPAHAARGGHGNAARDPALETRPGGGRTPSSAPRSCAQGTDRLERPELGVRGGTGPGGEGPAGAPQPPGMGPLRQDRALALARGPKDAPPARRRAVASRPLRANSGRRGGLPTRPASSLSAPFRDQLLRVHLPFR